ncbi:MAG: hypothetical protein DRG78_19845 [Epsilonproteobacteria bacterium]|nr:MAG: hypothetical protein DRG78_19845 [Campylobacterota bacterium]
MIHRLIKATVALSLVATVAFGANGARFNIIDGDVSEKYEHLLGDSLESSIGFTVSDPHEKINDAYAKRYGNKADPDYDKDWARNLDNLGFFSITNDAKLHSILKVSPEVAGFAPFNQLIYKKANEDKTYVGHLDPKTMLDIVGTKNEKSRKDFIAMFDPLDKWTSDKLGGKVVTTEFKSLPAKTMMNFEVTFEREGDLDDYLDEFQENFEAAFEDKKYIIAGYKNFKEVYGDLELDFEEYDAFFVYSLCHFTFSYSVFNKDRPDNGVFAPCSMYMYIKKDSNTVVIGMPRVSNWVSVMNLTDPVKVKWTQRIDNEIISIMKEMGAKEI